MVKFIVVIGHLVGFQLLLQTYLPITKAIIIILQLQILMLMADFEPTILNQIAFPLQG